MSLGSNGCNRVQCGHARQHPRESRDLRSRRTQHRATDCPGCPRTLVSVGTRALGGTAASRFCQRACSRRPRVSASTARRALTRAHEGLRWSHASVSSPEARRAADHTADIASGILQVLEHRVSARECDGFCIIIHMRFQCCTPSGCFCCLMYSLTSATPLRASLRIAEKHNPPRARAA